MSKRRLKIAITMGDPAGVGPEIIVKMFLKEDLYKYCDVFVIGDIMPMLSAQRRITKKIGIKIIGEDLKIVRERNIINLYDIKQVDYSKVIIGEATKEAGFASYKYLIKAIDLANSKKIDGIVTAPINKHALHMAGLKYPGHTEILAKFSKTKKYAMMLMGDRLKIILVTMHVSLKDVSEKLNIQKIFDKIDITHKSLIKDFKIKNPRIAVLGLNPHAGEAGAFGREEIEIITPAIKKAKLKNINVTGPYPPDTIFHKVVNEKSHDAVICMYHDQGLIPLKLLSFDTGVNVTLGLPFVRTSPDHGTAYDIAGTGKASCNSILSALKVACQIAYNRING
ncbi:MAG: 4-hydroxythreonine-4-phosphate dehydrogenase PdxA [Candidatus Goldbacteria bacterium]|nr:4-hydroxythreonine-4-phosphate dehydrogenase PdxA [Candidatus Goldiibacteriota bacterium]